MWNVRLYGNQFWILFVFASPHPTSLLKLFVLLFCSGNCMLIQLTIPWQVEEANSGMVSQWKASDLELKLHNTRWMLLIYSFGSTLVEHLNIPYQKHPLSIGHKFFQHLFHGSGLGTANKQQPKDVEISSNKNWKVAICWNWHALLDFIKAWIISTCHSSRHIWSEPHPRVKLH